MAIYAVILLAIRIVCISSVTVAGPIHATVKPGESEQYIITAHVYSGKENPSWTIDVGDKNNTSNVQTIIEALNILGASVSHGAQELPSLSGYAGLEVDHMINGTSLHSRYIPRCSKPTLEYSIVKYTAGSKISAGALDLINSTIKKCTEEAKATSSTSAKP